MHRRIIQNNEQRTAEMTRGQATESSQKFTKGKTAEENERENKVFLSSAGPTVSIS